MRKIFDFSECEFLFLLNNKFAVNSSGDIFKRLSNSRALNMSTGDIDITSSWDDDEED